MEDKVFCSETVTATATATATVIQTSSAASEMTGNDAVVSFVMDSHEINSSKWTNEKHSLYLRSIEASFVDQLYNSLDMRSCQTQSTNCSDAISTWKNHPDACISSGQYKVLHRGCWLKKSFKRQNSHLKDATDRHHVFPGNFWIQHFRNGFRKRLSSTATATSLQYQHAIVAEVIDQNFVEDASCSRKRVRTSMMDNASNDQVVPHCTSAATTEIPDSYVHQKE